MTRIHWQAYSKDNRQKVINEIKSALLRSEGYLINHQVFSDLSISFTIEIERRFLQELWLKLTEILTIDGTQPGHYHNESLVVVLLSVSFTEGKGDLKHNIPEVPG